MLTINQKNKIQNRVDKYNEIAKYGYSIKITHRENNHIIINIANDMHILESKNIGKSFKDFQAFYRKIEETIEGLTNNKRELIKIYLFRDQKRKLERRVSKLRSQGQKISTSLYASDVLKNHSNNIDNDGLLISTKQIDLENKEISVSNEAITPEDTQTTENVKDYDDSIEEVEEEKLSHPDNPIEHLPHSEIKARNTMQNEEEEGLNDHAESHLDNFFDDF